MPVVRPSQSRSRRNRRTVALKPPGYRISAEVTLALLREGYREAGSGYVPRGSPRSKRRTVGGDHVDRVKVKNSPWYLFLHIYCMTAPCDSRLFSLLLIKYASLSSSGNNSQHFFILFSCKLPLWNINVTILLIRINISTVFT